MSPPGKDRLTAGSAPAGLAQTRQRRFVHASLSEFHVGSQFDQAWTVTWRKSTDSETRGLHVREASSSCITEVRTARARTGLECWMVEGIQHRGLEAEANLLCDRYVLANGDIVVYVMWTMQIHDLSKGSWRTVREDETRVCPSPGSTC